MNSRIVALATLVLCSGSSVAADLAITYSLVPESDDGVMARGQINLQLSNISGQALDDVSVRAVLPGGGQLSGAVLDAVDMEQDEVVVVHGEYVMAQELSGPDQALPWSVTYRGADGLPHTASIAVVRQD
jgi:hypothetical protein